tara:strand:+ start:318 stop:932 length:615 start_codon:yes stop_codon:yes gene_type:complete
MKKFIFTLLIICFSAPAYADLFVWKDAETGISASFPDTWEMNNNQQPDTVLTIIGPDPTAMPICRLRVRHDGRFKQYPVTFESDIQKVAYDRQYWNDYLLAEYKEVEMTNQLDQSGLGRSFASHAVFNFEGDPTESHAFRQGVGFVSHYYDKVYIAECTANHAQYPEWVPHFLNFFKSVDFKKVYNEYVPGHYRDFLNKDASEE